MLGPERQIIDEYVNTGKVKLVAWIMIDEGRVSEVAAEAAECAGEQALFWPMREILFEKQSQLWRNIRETIRETTVRLASEIPGLDLERLKACMAEERYAEKVQAEDRARKELGVHFHPSFDVNGQAVMGVHQFRRWKEILDEALENPQP